MKLACIADFRKDINGLWKCFSGGESSFIEKILKQNDIETYVYSEKELGSTTDIAEDLTSFSDEIIIFMTDKLNYKLNIAIANKVHEEESECKIIFKVRENYKDMNTMQNESNDIALVNDYENLYEEIGEKLDLNLLYQSKQFNESENILENGTEILLGITNCNKKLYRNIDAIIEDVEKVCKDYEKEVQITFIGDNLENFEKVQQLLTFLEKYKGKAVFIFNTNLETSKVFTSSDNIKYNIHITKEYINNYGNKIDFASYKNNVNKVIVNASIFDVPKKAKKNIDVILKYTENIEIAGELKISESILEDCIPKRYMELMNREYQTLSRGILSSMTGEYISVPLTGFVKHMHVDKSLLKDEQVVNLVNEVCSINSSVLTDRINQKQGDSVYSIDKLDKIVALNEEISEIETICDEQESFPLNLAHKNGDSLIINGIVNNAELKLIEIPFSDFENIKRKKSDYTSMYIFTLDTEKSLQCFVNQIDRYYNTKQISESYLLYGKLKNMCRFMSRNYCSATKVPRLAVNDRKEICSCYEMDEKIGDLSNSIYELTQEVYYKHQMRLKESKCATCSANIGCPKCIFMPEHIKEKYCDIMINRPYVSDFLIDSMILTNLSRINKQVRNLNYKDIYISNEFFQNILPDELRGEELPYVTKYAFLINSDGFYALWSPNTNKTFSVTKEIAVVCEALFKRLSVADIIKVVGKYNNMSEDDATIFCEKVAVLLYNNNMLHRQVNVRE